MLFGRIERHLGVAGGGRSAVDEVDVPLDVEAANAEQVEVADKIMNEVAIIALTDEITNEVENR